MKSLKFISLLLLTIIFCCNNSTSVDQANAPIDSTATNNNDGEAALSAYSKTLPLDRIKLPYGFKIEVFGEVNNARQITRSPSGIIYVGNRDGDKVYALQD